MADEITLHLRIVVVPITREDFVAQCSEIIEQHRATCGREGLVPAVVAEHLVDRLAAQSVLVFIDDIDNV